MRNIICFVGLLISTTTFARTDLSAQMASTCEKMGTIQGVDCVKLQRQMESDDVVMDANGAGMCSLIWQWGSGSGNLATVGDLVLSCFKHVSNVRVSDETKDTCGGPISKIVGSSEPIGTVQSKVKRMLECIDQLAVPISKNNS